MKKLVAGVFAILIYSGIFAQESRPLLVINPAGHKGQICSLLITSDKKQIISGGFDKTIKVWDIESGEMVREILGEIGPGSNGMVYSMALSPDDKYLATGGWYGKNDESEPIGDIRIYDFQSGKLLFLLKGHKNVIHAMAFTADGKRLIAGDGESELILWDVPGQKIIQKYNHADKKLTLGQDDDVMDIAVHGENFMTADQFGRIKFWNINKKDTLYCDHYYEQIPGDGVAWSPDGKYKVAVTDTFVTIYDAQNKPIAEGTGDMEFLFASFSPDSKRILFGCTGRGSIHKVSVMSLEAEGWDFYADFEDIDNSVTAGVFINNDTYAISGGSKDEIIIIKLNGKNETPEVLKRMTGKGNIIYSAALSGSKIAFADRWTENFGYSKFNKQFDLVTKEISDPDPAIIWNRPVKTQGAFSLERYRRNDALNGGLYIMKDKEPYDSIPLEFWNGNEHRAFTFANNLVISGASYGTLKAYNYRGLELSQFIGHIGDIEGLSVSDDGKRLITACNDRTLKIWPIQTSTSAKIDKTPESVTDYCKRMKVYSTFGGVFKTIGVSAEAQIPTKEAWIKVIDAMAENDYLCNSFKNNFSEIYSNEIYPLVSVFIDENNEWIIWNEDGYFTSSKKGSKYVGYHINQGKDKESKYYPFEQFDLKYNRPDIILKDLSMVNQNVIDAYYLAYQKRLKRMGMDENQLSTDIHLPIASIKKYQYDATKQEVNVQLSASDSKYMLDRLNVFVNDVPVFGTQGQSLKDKSVQSYNTEMNIRLCPGKNKIQISVLNNKGAESLKETFTIVNNTSEKPDLYIISLGVSKYKDEKFNLNYAAKDASDVAHFFENCSQYNKVYTKILTNDQVTKNSILDLKNNFLQQAQTKDVVLVFAAGHGVLDSDLNYYFGTYDMNFNNPKDGGIAYEELEQLLDGIKPIKKLFLMDSCHSGELDTDEFSIADNTKTESKEVKFRNAGAVTAIAKNGIGLSQSAQLASDLFADLRRGTGSTIISSAGGAEFAMEGVAWNNGLFTYCLLSGIKEKTSDLNNDGIILLSEIQNYVYKKVEELSGGKQRPTTRRENLEFDFRIW